MCQPVNLAANGAARLDRCSCGCLHLHLGPVMLRLTPEVLPSLVEVLDLALLRLAPASLRDRGNRLPDPDRSA